MDAVEWYENIAVHSFYLWVQESLELDLPHWATKKLFQ